MATKSVTFRCPDEILDYIEQQVEQKWIDRTTVIVELLQAGMETIGTSGVTGVGQSLGNVRRLIQEALASSLPEALAPLQDNLQAQQAQLDELRGKLTA